MASLLSWKLQTSSGELDRLISDLERDDYNVFSLDDFAEVSHGWSREMTWIGAREKSAWKNQHTDESPYPTFGDLVMRDQGKKFTGPSSFRINTEGNQWWIKALYDAGKLKLWGYTKAGCRAWQEVSGESDDVSYRIWNYEHPDTIYVVGRSPWLHEVELKKVENPIRMFTGFTEYLDPRDTPWITSFPKHPTAGIRSMSTEPLARPNRVIFYDEAAFIKPEERSTLMSNYCDKREHDEYEVRSAIDLNVTFVLDYTEPVEAEDEDYRKSKNLIERRNRELKKAIVSAVQREIDRAHGVTLESIRVAGGVTTEQAMILDGSEISASYQINTGRETLE